MQLQDAIDLISKVWGPVKSPEIWADLGAGGGMFSRALLSVLAQGSTVHAVDIKQQDVHEYSASFIFHKADISRDVLMLPALDGILMANSLHYISDQESCIKKLRNYLKDDTGKFILIEYDTERANRWVPFPVSFSRATALFQAVGFTRIEKIGERPSRYQNDGMYAAVITS